MDILKIRQKAKEARDAQVEGAPSAEPSGPADASPPMSAEVGPSDEVEEPATSASAEPEASGSLVDDLLPPPAAPTSLAESTPEPAQGSWLPINAASDEAPEAAALSESHDEDLGLAHESAGSLDAFDSEDGSLPSEAEMAAKFARSRRELRALDPLGEFLAYYDARTVDEGRPQTVDGIEDQAARRFLAFHLAHEAYAVSILDIREILKTFAVTTVPRAPSSVLGVLSKRGIVMPVIDLAAALELREPDPVIRGDQRILVVGDADEVVGLRVDRVRSVVQIPPQAVEPVPGGLGPKSSSLLSGLGRAQDELFILLDVIAFLGHLHGSIESDSLNPRSAA